MVKKISLFLIAIFSALILSAPVFGQITPTSVRAKLSLAGAKTTFRNGEPIELVLELTADREGYLADVTTDNCDTRTDAVTLNSETGVAHWRSDAFGGGYRDYSSVERLSNTPAKIPFVLNDCLRFDQPGRYTIKFTTQRVRPVSAKPTEWLPAIPLTTNEVSFEIVPMTDAQEQQEVERILKAVPATNDAKTQRQLGQEMAFLTGDVALREKVRVYLNPGEATNYSSWMSYGIYISRNRALVLQLLEVAMRDPDRPVSASLLGTITSLRFLQQYGSIGRANGAPMMATFEGDSRNAAIRDTYVAELAAGLNKRSGKSRSITAMTILMNLPKDPQANSALLDTVRGILLQQFDTLHEFDQEYLVRQYWPQLRDQSLVPSLKKMLGYNGVANKNVHDTALQRLIEIAPEEARPFVIQEIKDPKSLVDLELLVGLKDKTLPEVDAVLLDQIKRLASSKVPFDQTYLKQKASLAARYATEAIYAEMMQIYRDHGARLQFDARATFLAYLARYNEREALPLIEQEVAQTPSGYEYSFLPVLLRLYFADSMDELLRKRLDSDDPHLAGHSAYLIGLYGSAKDQAALEARLARWRADWADRREAADPDPQGMIESEIIQSLIKSKSWKLSTERVNELRQSCLSKICRQNVQGLRD